MMDDMAHALIRHATRCAAGLDAPGLTPGQRTSLARSLDTAFEIGETFDEAMAAYSSGNSEPLVELLVRAQEMVNDLERLVSGLGRPAR